MINPTVLLVILIALVVILDFLAWVWVARRLAEAKRRLALAEEFIAHALSAPVASDVCMCGNSLPGLPCDNHSWLDQWEWSKELWGERLDKAGVNVPEFWRQ